MMKSIVFSLINNKQGKCYNVLERPKAIILGFYSLL